MDYNAKLKFYDSLIEKHPEIERKGKSMPYTSLNGHMFSHLSKDGEMGLRLSEEDRNDFMEKYQAELFVQHGRVMKEYVHVPDSLFSNPEELTPYLELSYEYVKSLKPKPSKKK